jgi:hypothetical protein
MRIAQIVIVVALATLVAPRVVYAQAGAVVVYGTAKSHERQVVAAAVARTVRQASWTVDNASFTQKETQDIITCLALDRPWPCVDPIASAKHVERVAVLQVDPDGKSVVVIGQILLNSTAVPSIERRFCDPCSDMALDQFAQELISVLLERSITRAGDTGIEIHTIPPGASIMVDGASGGTSDTAIAVSAGQHQVQIQLSGYRPHAVRITAIEGQTAKLTVRLVATDSVAVDDNRPSRLAPVLVGGLGAVALIGGSVYSFTRDPQHVRDQPKYVYSGAGLTVAGIGGVAVGIGLYLWFHHPRSRTVPVVSYFPRGGAVGWTTTF